MFYRVVNTPLKPLVMQFVFEAISVKKLKNRKTLSY